MSRFRCVAGCKLNYGKRARGAFSLYWGILAVVLDSVEISTAIGGWVLGVLIMWLLAPLFLRGLLAESRQFTADLRQLKPGQTGQRLTASSVEEWQLVSDRINDLIRHAAAVQLAHRAEETRLRQIVDGLASGFIAVDGNQTLLIANDQARELLNVTEPAPMGRKLWEWSRQAVMDQAVASVLKHGGRQECEWVHHRPGGDQNLQIIASAVRDESKKVIGATIIILDVSPLRRLEEVRRDFIANVSHELKTPLTAIRGLVETMMDDDGMPSEYSA